MSGWYVRKVTGVLRGVVSLAVRDRRLHANPAMDLNFPRSQPSDAATSRAFKLRNSRQPRKQVVSSCWFSRTAAFGGQRRGPKGAQCRCVSRPPSDRSGGDGSQRFQAGLGNTQVSRTPVAADPEIDPRRASDTPGQQGPRRSRLRRARWQSASESQRPSRVVQRGGLCDWSGRSDTPRIAAYRSKTGGEAPEQTSRPSSGCLACLSSRHPRHLRRPLRRRPRRGRGPSGRSSKGRTTTFVANALPRPESIDLPRRREASAGQ